MNKNKFFYVLLSTFFVFSTVANAQVGINTATPNVGSALHIKSSGSQKSLILPYVANDASRPVGAKSMLIYNETRKCIEQWVEAEGASPARWQCLYSPPAQRAAMKAHYNNVNIGFNNPSTITTTQEWVDLKFTNTDYDATSSYNAATGVFTAPSEGFYLISAKFESDFQAAASDPTQGNEVTGIGIQVDFDNDGNFVFTDESEYHHNGGRISRQVDTILKLKQNSKVKIGLKMPNNYSNFNNVDGYKGNTNFVVAKID